MHYHLINSKEHLYLIQCSRGTFHVFYNLEFVLTETQKYKMKSSLIELFFYNLPPTALYINFF